MIKRRSRDDILSEIYKKAYQYEKNYGGCAQCVLSSLQEVLGLEDGNTFKSATGLAGGIGLMGSTCGSLTGGVMALGLGLGRERKDFADPEKIRFKTYKLAEKLYKRFEEEYGSVLCRNIQERVFGRFFDLRDPRQKEEFEKAGGHRDKCPGVVAKAALWAGEILLEEKIIDYV